MAGGPIPEQWANAMRRRNIVSPRGEPSLTKLAGEAGIAVETVRRLVHGEGKPEPDTLSAVAKALGVSAAVVSRMAQVGRELRGAWTPPAEAQYLTDRQRRVLDDLIRVMVADSADVEEHRTRLRVLEQAAAYETGTPSLRERLDAAQDEAAETPDAPGTDGGA